MRRHWITIRSIFIVALALLLLPVGLTAQQEEAESQEPEDPRLTLLGTESYLAPPPEVLAAVMATQDQPLRLASQSPTGELFLRAVSDGFPTLARFAKESYDLGQFMIDPADGADHSKMGH